MTTAISISGLVKNFGQTRALDGLDLTVAAGEVHGFLGPNGHLGRDSPADHWACRAPRGPRPAGRRRARQVRRRDGRDRPHASPPDPVRRARAHQHAAHAGGAVPPSLWRRAGARAGGNGDDGMTAFIGTWRLVRLALRRDRVQLPLWLLGLVLIEASTVSSIVGLYPDEQERFNLAVTSANSPVSLMTNGLVSGSSLGATTMTQGLAALSLGVAFMSTLAVVRHTRQNEETGRAEMIGAGIVGRHASLTGALLVAIAANVVLALASAAVLIANDLPAGSSVLAGASLGFVGIAFGAIAAVAAQISETARGANGMAAA